MEAMYDVIVVGGGPAGGTAAFFLGEAGLRVLLLEKARLPRYKTCGGGLSLAFLAQQFPFSFEPAVASEVQAFSYAFAGDTVTIPVEPGVIGMVMRDQFDAHLLAHTHAELHQGVAVRQVTESAQAVTVETETGERYTARYLIGADGANSVVAHALGLRKQRNLAAAIEVEAHVSPPVLQRFAGRPVFIFGKIRLGYLWIFPKADHLSVGIAALHPRRGELQATLRRVMHAYDIDLDGLPLHGHPIPLYSGRERIATRRTLLAGDAAGLADPLSGEGIRYAVQERAPGRRSDPGRPTGALRAHRVPADRREPSFGAGGGANLLQLANPVLDPGRPQPLHHAGHRRPALRPGGDRRSDAAQPPDPAAVRADRGAGAARRASAAGEQLRAWVYSGKPF